MDIDALAEKHDWQGFEMYFYLFGALGTFSHLGFEKRSLAFRYWVRLPFLLNALRTVQQAERRWWIDRSVLR
jgi:hypothetical protein